MDHLSSLENNSVYLIREAYSSFKHMCMLWSVGKDSTVLLWLARKAFFGHVPFPLLHIDTTYKIPEMIAYRDKLAREWNLDIRYAINEEAIQNKQTFPDGKLDRIACCASLKTQPLTEAISGKGKRYRYCHNTAGYEQDSDHEAFDGVLVGLRADEEGSRSKERYFSPRSSENFWDVSIQPPEFWNQFNTDYLPGTHVRVHPLLDWTEVNIWQYIAREKIPTVSLYYDQGDGTRYRSIGCANCTAAVKSTARTPEEIVIELSSGQFARVAERAGRAQDKEGGGGLEKLRKDGYM
jgi:sulfate adenylyltransferase subunit 2